MLRATQALCLLPPSPRLLHSVPPTSRRTQMRTFGSVVLVGLTQLCSDFRFRLSRFCVDFSLHKPKNRVYLSMRRKLNNFFNVSYFSKTRKSEST